MNISPEKEKYINSANLKADTDFPYLILEVTSADSKPMNPGFGVMHWHEDLQFIYVSDGCVSVKTLSAEYSAVKGEAFFINKDVVHLVSGSEDCHYFSFLFPENLVSFYDHSPAAPLTRAITMNSNIQCLCFNRNIYWNRILLAHLEKLIELEKARTALYPYEVLNQLSTVWLLILENITLEKRKKESVIDIRMRCFLSYIEKHYAEPVTLEAIAESGSVSKSECLRCFRKSLGKSPVRYLIDYRLSAAVELLSDSALDINEIAYRSGFSDTSYFIKCFRESTGVTPASYRRRLI